MITNPNGQQLVIEYIDDDRVNYAIPGVRTFMPLYVTLEEYLKWTRGEGRIGISGYKEGERDHG